MEEVPMLTQSLHPTVPSRIQKCPLDHIYINPNVTRAAQRRLAAKLHSEISTEAELDRAFRTRQIPVRDKEHQGDQARVFNEFCVAFIEASKEQKDQVVQVLEDANARFQELQEVRARLEEVERRTYRFEMDLPDEVHTAEGDILRALKEEKEEALKKKKDTSAP
jgi:hypothetical protein